MLIQARTEDCIEYLLQCECTCLSVCLSVASRTRIGRPRRTPDWSGVEPTSVRSAVPRRCLRAIISNDARLGWSRRASPSWSEIERDAKTVSGGGGAAACPNLSSSVSSARHPLTDPADVDYILLRCRSCCRQQ